MPDAQPPVVPAQALYEHAACGLLLARTDGTILQANATFCGWLGYRADELVAKRRVQDLLTIGGRVFHQTHWAPLLQMQGSVAELKLDLIHRDGHTVPALINALRRRHGDTPCDELAVFIVSDRHKYERELLLARRNAETALASQRESQRALGLAEARLRLALESGRLHVWDVDPLTGQRRYDDSVAMLL
ncbi:MAG TPA: PAS domain-containing protein, partial [Burkholderiaceae bacterium]|nr:PAS domain-containing protein [Burkholderiaceae bacterium]